jgi:hypothetical protein
MIFHSNISIASLLYAISILSLVFKEHSRNQLWAKGARPHPTDFREFKCRSEGMRKFFLF